MYCPKYLSISQSSLLSLLYATTTLGLDSVTDILKENKCEFKFSIINWSSQGTVAWISTVYNVREGSKQNYN